MKGTTRAPAAGYYYSTPGLDGSVWLSRLPAERLITDVATAWAAPSLEYTIFCDQTTPVMPLEACGDGVTATLFAAGQVGRPLTPPSAASVHITRLEVDSDRSAAIAIKLAAPRLAFRWSPRPTGRGASSHRRAARSSGGRAASP